jgi:hypothetical protein
MTGSPTRLRFELLSANVLAWVAEARGDKVTTDVHAYLFDLYDRLAAYHRRRGHVRRAETLQRKANWHWRFVDDPDVDDVDDDELGEGWPGGAGGPPRPPRAVAMALPRRRVPVITDAVSRSVRRRPNHRP